jgi:hypothetical protein
VIDDRQSPLQHLESAQYIEQLIALEQHQVNRQ